MLRITGTAVLKRGAAQRQGLLFARKYILSWGDLRDTFANLSRFLDRVRYCAERGDVGMIEVTPKTAEFLAKPPEPSRARCVTREYRNLSEPSSRHDRMPF